MGRFAQRRFRPPNRDAHIENDKNVYILPLSLDEAKNGIEKEIYLDRGNTVEKYKAIIPSGTKDGDLIEIVLDNFNEIKATAFLRATING